MDTGWGMLIMKLLKVIWCTRRRRAGRFNVYQANHRINVWEKGVIRQSSLDRHFTSQFPIGQSSDLSGCCRSPVDRRASPTGSVTSTQSQSQLTPSRQLSDGERLRKVILELVDTERSYVKHLNNLLENYLEPLKNASFLSSAEVTALFGNIREIVAFQRLFLQSIQEALEIEPGFARFEHPHEFKNVLYSVSSAFLYYSNQFKLYSSFCASHSKAQKVLHPSEGNQALQEFLASRNPRQQHSATLESYLIKPIQRILKYPLLLQQLKNLTDPNSDEHHRLVEALKVMEQVAEHINEMQRIHEEYGAIFDHLFRQHQKSCKQPDSPYPQPIDLSPGDLLYYGGVEWLNISDFLGKIKKGLELHAMCFVFKTAVVFLCKERLRQKKKLMFSNPPQGAPGKNSSSEVEIIRYQVLIPVTEVQVRASTMKDMDNHFLWELIHLKSQVQRRSEKVYHLSNSTSEFRNAFLKTIRQIIRESVRNMSIPANKPMSSSKVNTNTLQPARSTNAKKKTPSRGQSATLQRHSAGNIDYDNLESYDNVPETHHHHHHHGGSMIVDVGGGGGGSNMTSSLLPSHDQGFRTRSKTLSDGIDELSDSTRSDAGTEFGTRSEGEEEVVDKKKATLGRTPNHLSLSTTSTLSTGSTGSQAKLIQASNQPSLYQPAKSLGGAQALEERLKFGTVQHTRTSHVESVTVGRTRSNHSERMVAPATRTRYSERGTHPPVATGDHGDRISASVTTTDYKMRPIMYTLPRVSRGERLDTASPRSISNEKVNHGNGMLTSVVRKDYRGRAILCDSPRISHGESLETSSLRRNGFEEVDHGGGTLTSAVKADYRTRPTVYASPRVSHRGRWETASSRSSSYEKGNGSVEPLRRDYGEISCPLISSRECRERLESSQQCNREDSGHTKWKYVNNFSSRGSESRERTELLDSELKTPQYVTESYGVLGGETRGAEMQIMTSGVGGPALTIDTLLQQLRALS